MSGPGRRFDPGELSGADGAPLPDSEAAQMLGVARELEDFAGSQAVAPSVGFEDRVMAALAAVPPPRPVVTAGFPGGLLIAIRDAWRITWSDGSPFAVRAQALALVLLVFVAVGSAGTLAAVGVSRLLGDDQTAPPTVEPAPQPSTTSPSPSQPTPSTSPSPSPSPSPSISPSPSASESADPEASDGSKETPDTTPRPTASPRPTAQPTDDDGTPEPDDTPEPEDTPDPDDTPEPDDTPKPSETPDSTDDGSSGPGSGDD